MHFTFVLELSNIDLWNIDVLVTHLDLLDTVSSVSILFVSIMSSRRLQDISSRHLQGMSSRRFQGMSSIILENIFSATFLSSKTSSRLLVRRKIVTLKTCWRRFQDMSWRRLQDQQMFARKRLRHRFFLVNFAKTIFARKLHWRYSTGL